MSDFLQSHSWPGHSITDTFDDSTCHTSNFAKHFSGCDQGHLWSHWSRVMTMKQTWNEWAVFNASKGEYNQPLYWSVDLQQSFREELEK